MEVLHRKLLIFVPLVFGIAPASGQAEGIDTTSADYQIGYQIGTWLPFIIIFTLALMVIIRSYRLSQKDGPK